MVDIDIFYIHFLIIKGDFYLSPYKKSKNGRKKQVSYIYDKMAENEYHNKRTIGRALEELDKGLITVITHGEK